MESQRTAPPKPSAQSTPPEPNAPTASSPTVVPSVQELAALRLRLDERHESTLDRVGSLVTRQKDLTSTIAGELGGIQRDGDALKRLESDEDSSGSLLTSITRRLGRRSRMLERRTVAVRLHEQYTEVHTTLRKASAFADELRLCAVEIAQEVDRLHGDVEASLQAAVEVEERIAEIEEELGRLAEEDSAVNLRRIDQLTFERSDLQTAVSLHEAKARLCANEVEPARRLRETVQSLHSEMAQYVLHASASIEGSGRHIQAMGLLADAPVVVSELQAGLDQLALARTATEAYLDQAHEMLTRVLPELSEHIRLSGSKAAIELEEGLTAIEQARSEAATDSDLRAAALAEVELLGVELGPSSPR